MERSSSRDGNEFSTSWAWVSDTPEAIGHEPEVRAAVGSRDKGSRYIYGVRKPRGDAMAHLGEQNGRRGLSTGPVGEGEVERGG